MDSVLTPIVILALRAATLACKFGLAIFVGSFLGLAELGLYGLAVGAIALGPVVVGFGLVHVIMRDAVTSHPDQLTDELRHYLYLTLAIYLPAIVVVLAAVHVFDISWLWTLIVAVTLFEHFGNAIFLLLSSLERPLLANVNAFLRSTAWILFYVPVAWWEPAYRSLTVLLLFWLVAGVLAFLQFAWKLRSWPWGRAFRLPFRRAWIAVNVRSAWIIYIGDLGFVSSQYIDRYIVTAFLGLQLAGVYFLYWSVANAVSTLVSTAILQTRRSWLIRAYDENGTNAHLNLVSAVMRTTALASIGYSVLVAGVFYVILPFLRQPATVSDYTGTFALIMAGMALRNVADMGSMALFTARRDRMLTLTNAASLIALCLLQLLLLPIAGLPGAGLALIVVFAGMIVWRHCLLYGVPGRGPVGWTP